MAEKNNVEMKKFERPWGFYQILGGEDNFQVKKLVVNSFEELSYQSHQHRAELWQVIAGEASVILDETEIVLKKGEYLYIPKGGKHQLCNKNPELLVVVEIQTGNYLGEDDITRFRDKYNR